MFLFLGVVFLVLGVPFVHTKELFVLTTLYDCPMAGQDVSSCSRLSGYACFTHAYNATTSSSASKPRKKKMEKRHPKEGGSLGKGITGME